MKTVRITEWVDIRAPRPEIFDLIVNIKRRMQLSPLWGITNIENPTSDYPNEGSSYNVEILGKEGSRFETVITKFMPAKKLAYQSRYENNANVTWHLQDIQQGTRIIYTEEFLAEEADSEELRQSVRKIVKEWLSNLRRYSELRGNWTKRLARKLVDRFYIEQTPPQRKTIITVLVMQSIGALTFIMAALALGVAIFLK